MQEVYVVGNDSTEWEHRQMMAAINTLRKLGYNAGKLTYDDTVWGLPPEDDIYFIVLVTQDILLERSLVWMLGSLRSIENQLCYIGARPLKLEPFIQWAKDSTWTPFLPAGYPGKVIHTKSVNQKSTVNDIKDNNQSTVEEALKLAEKTRQERKDLDKEIERLFRNLLSYWK